MKRCIVPLRMNVALVILISLERLSPCNLALFIAQG
jgi:hypothetical protein